MKSKFIIIAAGAISIASAWMPWLTVLGMTENGFMGDMKGNPGIFFIVLGALIALMGLLNKKWSAIVGMLFSLMVFALGCKYYKDGTSPDAVLVQAKVGYGVYMMILAGVLGLAGGIMRFLEKKPVTTA